MAIRIIDEFSVKPSGFLAVWRYARVVLNDETYVLTQQDVPGKPSINLSCISDYNRKSRRYNTGDLITSYFNAVAGERVTVLAVDCSPFATISAIPATPPTPPTPPPNPFGTATYGLYRYFEFCDIEGRPCRIDIDKKDFAGIAIRVATGEDPVVVISKKDIKEITDFIHPTECVIRFIAETNYQFLDLFTDDERMFRVRVYYTDTSEDRFNGFLNPNAASEPFLSPPYPVTMRANDGLGALRNVTYPIPDGGQTNMRQTWVSILQYCFSKTNLALGFYTMCNLYETKMANNLDNDPMALSSVNPVRFADEKGNIFDCYKVLEYVCKEFSGYITQENGSWWFIRVPELANPVVRQRKYGPDGLFLFAEQVANRLLLGDSQADALLLGVPDIDMHNAYKRVVAIHKFGFVPSVVFNGDFEDWTGSRFPYWNNFGVNYSRVQNTVPGINGQPVLIDNYSLQFNERTDLIKYIEPNLIRVNSGDKISVSLNINSNSTPNIMDYLYMRISIADDNGSVIWLGAPPVADIISSGNPNDQPIWVTSVYTYPFFTGLGKKDINTFIYTINMPESPLTGNLRLQFFGFNSVSKQVGVQYTYQPIRMDNIKIAITNVNNNAIPDGVLYVSEQQRFFTQSPEPIELLFGDNINFTQTSVTNPATLLLRNNISSIYTSDGSYSTLWYEYGLSSNQLPIANWASKSILKLFQSPFMQFLCGIKGDISSLNVFEICQLPNKALAFVSGDWDMRKKQWTRVQLNEIFYMNILTNDFGAPHTPGQSMPPYIMNANFPGNIFIARGVYSDEYTEPYV